MGRNILLLAVASLFSLALLEGGIRLFLPVYNPSGLIEYHYYDADGVPLARPGVARQWKNTGDYNVMVRINTDGLRDPKDLRTGTAADLYAVGDSFTFGHGVEEEERFTDLLAAYLGERVFNLGIPTDFDGYDALVGYAQRLGAPVRRLVIGVCMENDLHAYEQARDGYARSTPAWLESTKRWLFGHSATYNATTQLLHAAGPVRSTAIRLGLAVPDAIPPGTGRVEEAVLSESARRLARLVAERDVAEVVVLIIPSRGLWAGPAQAEETARHERFVELVRAEGLRVVDVRVALEAGGDPLRYHFPHDGHWNAEGHRVAAEHLAAALTAPRATVP